MAMIGKRAKILSHEHVEDLLVLASQTRHPIRNQTLALLSVKAGLRAGEIANLTWPMVIEPTGAVGISMELQDRVAKKGSGRVIPIHPDLHATLGKLAHRANSTALFRSYFPGSYSWQSGPIAASKASTFAAATGSTTGSDAKTGTAGSITFATEFGRNKPTNSKAYWLHVKCFPL